MTDRGAGNVPTAEELAAAVENHDTNHAPAASYDPAVPIGAPAAGQGPAVPTGAYSQLLQLPVDVCC